MIPKPEHLGPEYGAQFQDRSVVEAYSNRPPYPPEVFDILVELIRDQPRRVLELGCGTGDLTRGLAPRVARLDAVDASARMIARAKNLPGGQHPHIYWIHTTAEAFDYPSNRYTLVVAAASLHWMDWHEVLPQIRRTLTPNGRLAIVLGRRFLGVPWEAQLRHLIPQFSTNQDFAPYDLVEELTTRNLFVLEQRLQTTPVPFIQSVDSYIESIHSQNGFSRERMGVAADTFDRRVRDLISQTVVGEWFEFKVVADLAWGMPRAVE